MVYRRKPELENPTNMSIIPLPKLEQANQVSLHYSPLGTLKCSTIEPFKNFTTCNPLATKTIGLKATIVDLTL